MSPCGCQPSPCPSVYQFPGELLVNWGQPCKCPVSTGNGVVRPATLAVDLPSSLPCPQE